MWEAFWLIVVTALVGLTALVVTMADMNHLDEEDDVDDDL